MPSTHGPHLACQLNLFSRFPKHTLHPLQLLISLCGCCKLPVLLRTPQLLMWVVRAETLAVPAL